MEVTETLEDLTQSLGIQFYNLRKAKGITQKAMAKELQVSQARISEIEAGVADTKISTLLKYAQYFNHELWIFVTPPEPKEDDGTAAELPSD